MYLELEILNKLYEVHYFFVENEKSNIPGKQYIQRADQMNKKKTRLFLLAEAVSIRGQ